MPIICAFIVFPMPNYFQTWRQDKLLLNIMNSAMCKSGMRNNVHVAVMNASRLAIHRHLYFCIVTQPLIVNKIMTFWFALGLKHNSNEQQSIRYSTVYTISVCFVRIHSIRVTNGQRDNAKPRGRILCLKTSASMKLDYYTTA